MRRLFRNPLFIAGLALTLGSFVIARPALSIPGIALMFIGWIRSKQ